MKRFLSLFLSLPFQCSCFAFGNQGLQASSWPEQFAGAPLQEQAESGNGGSPALAIESSPPGSSMLHSAAAAGSVEGVKQLIERGSNIHTKHSRGRSPLHEAARHGHADVVKILIEAGADPHDTTTHDRDTPLHLAAEIGSIEVCKILIEAGKDIDGYLDIRNAFGHTALASALKEDPPHQEIAKLLIQVGADPSIPDTRGRGPLSRAAWEGQPDIVKLLIQAGADVNAPDRFNTTPLHEAVTQSVAMAEALIKAGANVNPGASEPPTLAIHRGTPLQIAANVNYIDMVKLLIHHGANVNVQDRSDNSPLHIAIHQGHGELAKLLIKAGANVQAGNDAGNSPVQVAAFAGLPEVIKLLIDAGALINVKDQVGDTPLHDAALQGQVAAAQVLIAAGADVNTKNNAGNTPLALAEQHGHGNVAEVLKEAAGGR